MADRGGGWKWSAPPPPLQEDIVHVPNQLFRNKKEVEFKNKLTLHVGFQLDQGACLNQDEIWKKIILSPNTSGECFKHNRVLY